MIIKLIKSILLFGILSFILAAAVYFIITQVIEYPLGTFPAFPVGSYGKYMICRQVGLLMETDFVLTCFGVRKPVLMQDG